MKSLLKWFTDEESGQGMVEYGLIIALVACAVVLVVKGLGGQLNTVFTNITNSLKGAQPAT